MKLLQSDLIKMKYSLLTKWKIWSVIAIIGVASGFSWWSIHRSKTIAANFEIVRRGDLTVEVPIIGTLDAARSVDITAPISNDPHNFKIARMAEEGAQVKAGEMVMELDTQEINQRLQEFQSELGKNEEELKKRKLEYDVQMRDMRVALEEAKVKHETTRNKLSADPTLMAARDRRQFEIEHEQAEQQVKLIAQKLKSIAQMSRAELSTLENNIAKIRMRVEQAEEHLKACIVKAPIAGTLIHKVLSGNTKRKVGEQTCHHETIMQIPDLSTLRLEAMIEESYAGLVQPGQNVSLKIDALPDEKLSGKVVSAGSVLRMRRWDNPVKIIDAIIELEQKIGRLSPGMTASGQIEVERIPNVLLAPIKAVREKAGHVIVKVPGSDGREEERKIRVGRKNHQFVEVLEGLREGEKVVI
jgi:HlyD family secretion protein